jgi:universal stress protein E
MEKISRILVVIDPTASEQPALLRAVELAERFAAEIELLICDRPPGLPSYMLASPNSAANAQAALQTKHDEKLEKLARETSARLGDTAPAVRTDVRWNQSLADGIVHKANDSEADLVIKDTHYHSVISRTIFTHTDWELIRLCPAPLWLARTDATWSLEHIVASVAPLDVPDAPETLDQRILRTANLLRNRFAGTLHVFNAYPLPTFGATGIVPEPSVPPGEPDTLFADQAKLHRDALDELLRDCNIDTAETTVVAGLAETLLVEHVASIGANLVVMGAISRSSLERMIVGSTAERTLDRLSCDVLVIK